MSVIRRMNVCGISLRVEVQDCNEVDYTFYADTPIKEAVNSVLYSFKRETIVIQKCVTCAIGFTWNNVTVNERFIICSNYLDEVPDFILDSLAANIVIYKLREINPKDVEYNKKLAYILNDLLEEIKG